MYRLTTIIIIALSVVACGQRRAEQTKSAVVQKIASSVFLPIIPPSDMTGEPLRRYMSYHYWDKFDFADTVLLKELDAGQVLDAYAVYVASYLRATEPAPMDSLMRRAAVSRPMLDYFATMADKVLNDPNSQLRSDELYIPVLQSVLSSSFYDDAEKIAPRFDLNMALQNRVGRRANDFKYTLSDGKTGRLYNLKADYTLVFISNPGCPMCRDVRQAIESSSMLRDMIDMDQLKIVVIYTDEDLTEWRKYSETIPAKWINAYDKGCVIRDEELYSLRAIPALYLLDREKKVLVKDSASVAEIEWMIDQHMKK